MYGTLVFTFMIYLGVAGSVSDHSPAVSKALDRFGQALQAALAAGSQQVIRLTQDLGKLMAQS